MKKYAGDAAWLEEKGVASNKVKLSESGKCKLNGARNGGYHILKKAQ